MRARALEVAGAYAFTPPIFADDRGRTVTTFQETAFAGALGRPLFPVAQTLHSTSARDVVRGLHFTATPPGCAKYVTCARGAALDLLVDLRVGSPTFGRCAVVELDHESHRSVYVPVGVGHGFVALRDDTVISYLLSLEYRPDRELAVSALDPALGLPVPATPLLSPRDAAAPTLAEARAAGLLPDYRRCVAAA